MLGRYTTGPRGRRMVADPPPRALVPFAAPARGEGAALVGRGPPTGAGEPVLRRDEAFAGLRHQWAAARMCSYAGHWAGRRSASPLRPRRCDTTVRGAYAGTKHHHW